VLVQILVVDTLAQLQAATLVAVVRDSDSSRAARIVEGLIAGGMRAIEITANTPGAFELIERLRPFTDKAGIVLGVGTIKTAAELERAHAAGAKFVVSPHTDPGLIGVAKGLGLVVIPGAMTPTEVMAARAAGADVIKIFPISAVGGPSYLKWLRGPIPEPLYWVSGDVEIDQLEGYLAAGATLIGLTSALTAALEGEPAAAAKSRAGVALEALARAKESRISFFLVAGQRPIQIGLKDLRRLPGSEHAPLDGVVPGVRGHGVRARLLLKSAGIPATGNVRVTGKQGAKTFPAQRLYDGGFFQFAANGQPISEEEGGPIKLHLTSGGAAETIFGLLRIEAG
jgi:2-dehydro-3-deoxyphosphogluconate aldolase / (4S)-4-hydroxy-2-oxoglutarate aldolase